MNKLVTRARAAARSARLLLDEGDTIGAVSRAYYAMFDLARAALRDIDPKLAAAKTHATIISRFSKHMVQDRGFPQELGRALRRAFDARLVADYSDTATIIEVAKEVVDAMDQFLAAVTKAVGDDS
jgi:uncharacterized protein (UPF0332 family)